MNVLVALMISGAPPVVPDYCLAYGLPCEVLSDTLRAMQEPPVGSMVASDEAIRFLWLRSFHKPVLVQVARRGGQRHLLVKVLDKPWGIGVEGVFVGKLISVRRRVLTDAEWQQVAALTRADFWGQSEESEPPAPDGATWIVEGVHGRRHHVVSRWSPEGGAFRELCLALLKLSGIRPAANEVY